MKVYVNDEELTWWQNAELFCYNLAPIGETPKLLKNTNYRDIEIENLVNLKLELFNELNQGILRLFRKRIAKKLNKVFNKEK